jgi:hypothetical protein
MAILTNGNLHVTVDCGPFGAGSGGHSHSDTLSITVYRADREVLIDAGTYSYSDPGWRNRFRGSAAHNTIRIAGRDQAAPVNPFRWKDKPEVHVEQWDPAAGVVRASCSYGGFRHTRRIELREDALLVLDTIEGSPGDWLIEQFWHPASAGPCDEGGLKIGDDARLSWGEGSEEEILEGGDYGWRSRGFGQKESATVVRLSRMSALPVSFAAALDFDCITGTARVAVMNDGTLRFWRENE